MPSPEDTGGGPTGGTPGGTAQDDGATGQPGGDSGEEMRGRSREWWSAVLSSCRAVRAGKELGFDRRHSLEDAAGGKGRVDKYCRGVLRGERGDGNGTSGDGEGRSGGSGRSGGGGGGNDDPRSDGDEGGRDRDGKGGGWGRNGGGDGGGSSGGNDHHGDGGVVKPASSPDGSGLADRQPVEEPAPSYGVL
jgi:hypothetical protein